MGYWEVDMQFASALQGVSGELEAPSVYPDIHWIRGRVHTRGRLEILEKSISYPCRNSKDVLSVVSSPYRLSYRSAKTEGKPRITSNIKAAC
jgi:hypothetical protein